MTEGFLRSERRLAVLGAITLLVFAVAMLPSGALGASEEFPVAPPPFTPDIFPCSSCHAGMEPDMTKRELSMHTEIKLRHAPEVITWCFSCHDPKNRDKLHLVNGDLIDFTESYRLCGQCHGTNYRDWKAGIHGKRVGYFSGGKRTYFLCVNCHNPHDPKFKPLKPEPPPFRPEDKENG
jgi:formate-dependent nitrite reductase cytochrome c552 subunit